MIRSLASIALSAMLLGLLPLPALAADGPSPSPVEQRAATLTASADTAFASRDYERAVALYTQVLALPDLPDAGRFSALRDRGRAFYFQDKFGLSLSDLSAALDLRPSEANVLMVRSIVFDELGRRADMLADRARAGRADHGLSDAWASKALDEYRAGRIFAALYRAEVATEIDPHDPFGASLRCQFSSEADRFAVALPICDAAAALPDLGRAYGHIVFTARALLRSQLGDCAGAASDLKSAAKVHPETTWRDLKSRGSVDLCLRKTDAALNDFSSAVAANPNDAFTHVLYSLAEIDAANVSAARAELVRAAALDPSWRPYATRRIAGLDEIAKIAQQQHDRAAYRRAASAPATSSAATSSTPTSSTPSRGPELAGFDQSRADADTARASYDNGVEAVQQNEAEVQQFEQSFEPPPSSE